MFSFLSEGGSVRSRRRKTEPAAGASIVLKEELLENDYIGGAHSAQHGKPHQGVRHLFADSDSAQAQAGINKNENNRL